MWLTDVDWETQDEPERQAEEGLRHASSVTETTCWEAEFFCCTAPQAVGLHMTKWAASRRGVHVPVNTDDRDAAAAAEAAQAEQAEQAEQAQRDREERRQLLALAPVRQPTTRRRRGGGQRARLSRCSED